MDNYGTLECDLFILYAEGIRLEHRDNGERSNVPEIALNCNACLHLTQYLSENNESTSVPKQTLQTISN